MYICCHLCYLAATQINKNCTAFFKDHKHLTSVFFKVKVPINQHISQKMAFFFNMLQMNRLKILKLAERILELYN